MTGSTYLNATEAGYNMWLKISTWLTFVNNLIGTHAYVSEIQLPETRLRRLVPSPMRSYPDSTTVEQHSMLGLTRDFNRPHKQHQEGTEVIFWCQVLFTLAYHKKEGTVLCVTLPFINKKR